MSASPSTASRRATWPLVLFGLAFMGVGGFLLWLSWGMWSLYLHSATWARVPAMVTEATFSSHRGSKGGMSYSVACRYTYEFEGHAYTGTRVGVESGGSSDAYHRRRYEALAACRDQNLPVSIWVDPAHPGTALVFRERTSTLYVLPLCGLVFGLPGLGVLLYGLASGTRASRQQARLAATPDRPWRAEPHGGAFEITDSPLKKAGASLGIGLFLAVFMSVFWIAMGSDRNAPFFAKVLISLFTLMPVALLATACYQALQYRKYGRSSLMLRQMPLVIGRDNSAILYVGTHLVAESGVDLTLTCVRRDNVRRGNKTSIETTTLHTQTYNEKEDFAARVGNRSAIPVRFSIPAGCPDSATVGPMPHIVWTVSAKASTPGIDFAATFQVPAFTVADSHLIELNPMARP